jgi:hypothetical protein
MGKSNHFMEYSVSYKGYRADMRAALLSHLRKSHLVSEVPEGLLVIDRVRKSNPKGIFGLGPHWEERTEHLVTFFSVASSPLPTIQQDFEFTADVEYIIVKTRIMERQNGGFPWRIKEVEIKKSDFLHIIQEFVTTEYKVRKR